MTEQNINVDELNQSEPEPPIPPEVKKVTVDQIVHAFKHEQQKHNHRSDRLFQALQSKLPPETFSPLSIQAVINNIAHFESEGNITIQEIDFWVLQTENEILKAKLSGAK